MEIWYTLPQQLPGTLGGLAGGLFRVGIVRSGNDESTGPDRKGFEGDWLPENFLGSVVAQDKRRPL